jgi:type VI secretion system protein ImpM
MSVGFFGKLPSHGDFIRRRVSDTFVEAFDAWLQACLLDSQTTMGKRQWLDLYLTSPSWRFAFAAGVCGPGPVFGLLAPSVDSAGRYFPIAVVAELPQHAKVLTTAVRSARFFAKAEQLVVETLAAERVDFERFDAAVALLAADVPMISNEIGLDASASSALHEALSSWQLPIAGARDVGAAFSELLSLHLESIYRPLALWWTDGSAAVEPSCLFSKGLPTPDRFPAFLNGAWAHHQWRVALPREAVPEGDAGDPVVDEQLSFRSAAATDVGRKRANNEDGYIERPEVGVWVVADGMGGHRNGEVASRMVCDALMDFQPEGSFEEAIAGATRRVQDVNEHLYRSSEGSDTLDRSGSTVVVMLARGSQLALLWAGDSRLYRWREGTLNQLSRDHSLAELTGSTTVESNIITRAVGIQADLTLDLHRDLVKPDDRFLLCSDGLTRVVSDGLICELMGAAEIQSTVGGLIKAALDAGGPDNVTVLVAEAIR